MDTSKFVIEFFVLSIFATILATAMPVKRYDQRQDGDLNIQAHLDKIVLLVIPNKNINILDIKGQGQFDNYEDILPLLGKESAAVNEVKFKLASDDPKIKSIAVPSDAVKEEQRKEAVVQLKVESKTEPKESKKAVDARETVTKKAESETRVAPETTQKKSAAKSTDGRTYQTLHLSNNRERIVSVSQETEAKKSADNSITKVEKL